MRTKKITYLVALASAAIWSLTGAVVAQAANDYIAREPSDTAHETIADGCIDVWAKTDQASAYRIRDAIPVRVVWVRHPSSKCRQKQAEVKLLPPQAMPPAAKADPAQAVPNAGPDVAKVLMPTLLEYPEINLHTIKTGQLTTDPSDVDVDAIGPTGEEFDPETGDKILVQDLWVTQSITMQTVPDKAGSGAKQDEKKPIVYKTQADIVLDFDYAVFEGPDHQPVWLTAKTLMLTVGIHQSARISTTDPNASDTLLREGDLSDKDWPIPPAAFWWYLVELEPRVVPLPAYVMAGFVMAGIIPMLVWVFLTVRWSMRRERVLTRNEQLWRLIDKAVEMGEAAEVNGTAFPNRQYRRIFHIIREHLGVLGLDTTQTLERLGNRADLNGEAVSNVFNSETLLFDEMVEVTREDWKTLLSNIEVIIPRR